ncbi:acyltransferase family protein [Hymenobacter crusticola]|uniref:Acyltransferase 3 domain-containing protein n=1 Tax=Hymenobacter crusticola TaxID=1770526 RepID=A0A243WKW7_9BACT|nr:acyltransferase [Hymenobacter crusticola]OUJ75811.1 hypothetical protein BXP70_00465 [Hymenobacter crusticola]
MKTYFPALTGIRAIAAFLVFFYHYVLHIPATNQPFVFKWLILCAHQGHIGVPIFFVLSGFLITTRYAGSVELTGPWFRRYLQNRFARIYPIYFLLTLLTFAVMLVSPTHEWYAWPAAFGAAKRAVIILLNLTLTRAYFQSMIYLGVPTAWTLTVEETFYLCAPLLLLGLKHNFRRLYAYPLMLLLLGTVIVAVCSQLLPTASLMPSIDYMLSQTFFGRCVEFFVGMGLALWMRRQPSAQPVLLKKATLLGGLGILAVVVVLAAMEQLPSQPLTQVYLYYLVNNVLLPLPIALLLWGLIRERTWLQQLLASKTFDLLGKSSYVFYLIHLGVVDTFFSRYLTDNWFIRLGAYTLLSVALYKWIEHPLHQRLRAKAPAAPKPALLNAA